MLLKSRGSTREAEFLLLLLNNRFSSTRNNGGNSFNKYTLKFLTEKLINIGRKPVTIIQPLTNPPSKDKMSYLYLPTYPPTLSLSFSIFFSTFSSSNYTHIDHNLIDIPKLYYPRNETSPSRFSLFISLSLFPPPLLPLFFFFFFFILLSLCRGVASMSIPPQDIATRNRDEGAI